MKKFVLSMLVVGTFFLLCNSALATPVLQVYLDPSTAGDSGGDQDTWFGGLSGTLYAAGAYSGNVSDISNAYLVFSVPQGSSGTISVDSTVLDTTYDTRAEAFATIAPPRPELPPDFNNHYPFQDAVSDFLLLSIGDFDNNPTPPGGFPDWNADNGIITYSPNTTGEIKDFALAIAGFPLAHVDVIALVSSSDPRWRINPGSHDATATPEPATMLLLGSGLIGLIGFRKKFRKK